MALDPAATTATADATVDSSMHLGLPRANGRGNGPHRRVSEHEGGKVSREGDGGEEGNMRPIQEEGHGKEIWLREIKVPK